MPLGIPNTREFPWDQKLSHNMQQLTNKVTGGINTWAVNPTVGVDGEVLSANHAGYTGVNTTTSTIVRWDGSTWVSLVDGDKVVTAPQMNLYVSQNTGNDANDGMTASTAWRTISKFYQEVNKYNLLSKQVNLYLGAGTYRILFPPSSWGGTIRVYGASSATVTIQRMEITRATFVMLQDVTIAYPQVPDSTTFYWPINVEGGSTLQFGQNVVLGPIGNYIPSAARYHVSLYNSSLWLFGHSPVTLTGSVNVPFILKGSQIWVNTFFNQGAGVINTPGAAPAVDTGAVYTYLPPLTESHTTATINASSSITVSSFINLSDGSGVNGPPGWKLSVTGSVVGSAYTLTGSSFINGQVARGSIPSVGIGYPTSISSGTRDASSTVQGTPF
jgi:hypothetical protein